MLVMIGMIVSTSTRLVLLFASLSEITWNWTLLASFGWGILFDLGAVLLVSTPLVLILAALPRRVFSRRIGRAPAYAIVFAAIASMLFVALAEIVFWDEFGARFNFIAVDYLIYTTEVFGNIRESYPLPLLLTCIGAAAALLTWACVRIGAFRTWFSNADETLAPRWSAAVAWICAAAMAVVGLQESSLPTFANNYHRELAKNGMWSFVAAFRANQLDYGQFYPTLPPGAAFVRMRRLLGRSPGSFGKDERDLLRLVSNPGPEMRLNVIQITVESLSAEFLGHFGNKDAITPNLDGLVEKSLVFDRFYATGNRTDRGMEALTLSVPPTPGRSLVKRPDNEHLFTLGSVFRTRGYDTAFIYGGYGYFDNMNYFFGQNGYRVVDRGSVAKSDVTFANVWGACDADLYRWTLREADQAHEQGKPFFHFVMTTSNHRPYTFPDGMIDLPSKSSGRRGAVKYTDFAIGEFLKAASTRPWFQNTIFVIVADHCASSAGKAELPVERYHIPLIVYAPGGQVSPGRVHSIVSQIDYAPTLLGLMRWTYHSRFFGRDVLAPDNRESSGRALIGNYQRLGLYEERDGANLAILAPVRSMTTWRYDAETRETLPVERDDGFVADAIAYYETASLLLKSGRQSEYVPDAP